MSDVVATILVWSIVALALLALGALPMFIVARQEGAEDTIRSFAIGAVVIGVLIGVVRGGTTRLVDQCIEAGNRGCDDVGGAGLTLVLAGGFLLTAWFRTWSLRN